MTKILKMKIITCSDCPKHSRIIRSNKSYCSEIDEEFWCKTPVYIHSYCPLPNEELIECEECSSKNVKYHARCCDVYYCENCVGIAYDMECTDVVELKNE